jgi:GT2 family glycosyltransferase
MLNRLFCYVFFILNKSYRLKKISLASGITYYIPQGRFSQCRFLGPDSFVTEKKAYFWDDYIFQKKGMTIREFRIKHLAVDLLMHRSLGGLNRIAVREDVVNDLLSKNIISFQQPTVEAFMWLVENEPLEVDQNETIRRNYLPLSFNYFIPTNIRHLKVSLEPVSIIINYRDKPGLMNNLLRSIINQNTERKIELILINNLSTLESIQAIKGFCKKLDNRFTVKHLNYESAYNHSAQTNLGVECAANELIIIGNNDVELISKNTIDQLVEWLCIDKVATVGPRITGKNGRLVSAGMEYYFNPETLSGLGIRESENKFYSLLQREVPGNPFAFCAVKRSFWLKLGGLLQDAYPTQYNDADFCLRSTLDGYKHIYLGNLRIFHEPGSSEVRTQKEMEKLHLEFCIKHEYMSKYDYRVIKLETSKMSVGIKFKIINKLVLYALWLKRKFSFFYFALGPD